MHSGGFFLFSCGAFSIRARLRLKVLATISRAASPVSPVEGVPPEDETGASEEAAGASEDTAGSSETAGASEDSSAVLPSSMTSSLTVYSAPPVAYSVTAVMVIFPSAGV